MAINPGLSIPEKIKVSVLGVGSLGKEHVRIYSELAYARKVDLVGIYDVAADKVRHLSEKYHVPLFNSIEEAVASSDAVSIVTPTTTR